MTTREWAATKRYESLTKEERENLAKIGIEALKTRFCSSLQGDLLQSDVQQGRQPKQRYNQPDSLDFCDYIENYGESAGELKSIEQKIEVDIKYIENKKTSLGGRKSNINMAEDE